MSQNAKVKAETTDAIDPIESVPKEVVKKDDETVEDEEDHKESEPVVEQHILAQQTPMAFNVITAPRVCPPGYRLDSTGKCRRKM